MAKKNVKELQFSDFIGGYNTDDSPLKMPEHHSPSVLNMLPTIVGSVGTRKGYTKHNSVAITESSVAKAIVGLVSWELQGGTPTEYFNAQAGTKFYKDVSGTWTDISGSLTLTNHQDNLMSADVLDDMLLCANRQRDAQWKWSGTGNAEALGGSPPSGTIMVAFNRRAWTFGNDTNPLLGYYSNLGDPDTWTTATDFLNFDEGQGSEIRGAVVRGPGSMLVFKDRSIHLVEATGTIPAFERHLFFDGIGCVSHQSIAILPGGIIIWADIDDIYMLIGNEVVSATIDPKTKRPRLRTYFRDNVDGGRLPYCWGRYYKNLDIYRWFHASTGRSYNDRTLDLHIKTRSWWPTDIAGNAACMRVVSGQQRLMVGDISGYVYRHDNSNADDGSAISCNYSPPWRGGSVRRFKADSIYATISKEGNYDINCDIFTNFDSTPAISDGALSIKDISGAQWDVASWDVDNWPGENTSLEGYMKINRVAKAIRANIEHSGINQPMTIHDITMLLRPLKITARTD